MGAAALDPCINSRGFIGKRVSIQGDTISLMLRDYQKTDSASCPHTYIETPAAGKPRE